MQYRATYHPQEVAQQQALQAQFGPTKYGQQIQALQQLDPAGYALRQQLAQTAQGQLGYGSYIDPTTSRQIQQSLGARQASCGNIYGNAAAMAQAVYQGQRAQQLLGQREAEGGSVASTLPSYVATTQNIGGITPNTAFEYVNPSAGSQAAQFGLQNYPFQYNAAMQPNPWMNALSGAVSGAGAGFTYGGGYGALGGGLTGGLYGGLFGSDPRMKTDVKKVGNVPIYEYRYRAGMGPLGTFRGPMSTDVKKHAPEAVTRLYGR